MSLALISGGGIAFPSYPWDGPVGTIAAQTLNASDATQKLAFIGQVFNKDYATKNIQSVKFRAGNLTSWGAGSVLTVSLQDVSSTGAPVVPDESIDQSLTLTGAALVANTWTGGNLNANRANVAFGSRLAVVFQISTFTASDSIQINTKVPSNSTEFNLPCVSKKSTTWATTTNVPVVSFGFDDGTTGTFLGSHPILNRQVNQFNSGSSPNEYALRFVAALPMRVYGAWLEVSHDSASSTSTLNLYDSANNVLATASLDQSWFQNLTTQRFLWVAFSAPVTLAAGALYRLGLSATTANNITLAKDTTQNANDFQTMDGGTNIYSDTRTGSGAWSSTTTQRPRMGLLISHLDDGVFPSSSGGGRRRQ